MQKILIGTTNLGKVHEINLFLKDLPVKIVSLKDVGIDIDVEETGKTYQQNSQKKALFYAKLSDLPTIADDGGLEILALNNEPGIHSRRWLGFKATDEELFNHLKKIAKQLPADNKVAYFRTVISFALPNGKVESSFGEVKGIIKEDENIEKVTGYPYRSFFYLPEINKYYLESQLSPEELKLYNHRFKAVKKMIPEIKKLLNLN